MNEADTRAELIDPQLRAAGWVTGGDVLIEREYLERDASDRNIYKYLA